MMASFVLVSALAFAQPEKGNPEERLERLNEHMKTALDLSDDQYAKVAVMNEEMITAMAEVRETKDREAAKDIRDNYRDQLETVLTKEQMEKAKELFEEQRKRHRNKKHKNE